MTFAQPLMLLGALAALIPLIVHLFDRRRPRPVPFAAISFVLKSQKRTASRLKLKRLILYILRTLILLALPIALARPELRKEAAAGTVQKGPAATAIVLDASLSMRFDDGTSLFSKAKDRARDALKQLMAEEPATVVLCGRDPQPPAAPSFERGKQRGIIDDAQPTWGASDLNHCMDLAAHALEESPLQARRIVLISDFTQNSLRLEAPPPTYKDAQGQLRRPEFVLEDVARGRTLPNHAIVDLKIQPAVQIGPRAMQFTFTVRNFSSEPAKDLEAALKIGDQVVAKGFLDLAANGTAQKTLTWKADHGGTFGGEVTLTPDPLEGDDHRAFAVTVPKELRALVVNGAPNPTRYRDEAFFVDAALNAPGSPVRESIRDVDAAFREDFSQYDVVLLLNVPAPTPDIAAKLVEFVRKGGGLFIAMGDQVDAEQYNARLGELLPRPLRLVKTAAQRDEPDAEQHAAKLSDINENHPLLTPFSGKAREGLMSSRFYRYMLLEAGGQGSQSDVLATYQDGAPALAAARRGAGRVLLLTTTADRDWSDFAIRTSFLPLMHRACAWLSGALEEREQVHALVGDTVTLKPDAQQKLSAVRGPSGVELEAHAQPDGSYAAGPIVEPGVHQVLDDKGNAVPSLAFPSLLDPAESDLTKFSDDALSAYFGEESVKAASAAGQSSRVPFWTWLIVTAVLAFFVEGVLLRK
ncbi:MAG: BatA domain-containing protein [Myxococcaceae bacterium]